MRTTYLVCYDIADDKRLRNADLPLCGVLSQFGPKPNEPTSSGGLVRLKLRDASLFLRDRCQQLLAAQRRRAHFLVAGAAAGAGGATGAAAGGAVGAGVAAGVAAAEGAGAVEGTVAVAAGVPAVTGAALAPAPGVAGRGPPRAFSFTST